METLEEQGIADNTLVMVSSDNGPETLSVYHMRHDHNHDGARPWRGVKRDQWEGGHRIPFIARWPGTIAAGTKTDQTVCLCDLMATCAALVGYDLPDDAGEDSYNAMPVLIGEQDPSVPVRLHTLHQSSKTELAIRKGPWKYLDHQGSGGNSYEEGRMAEYALPENEPNAPGQLYNLDNDPGETTNLYFKHGTIVEELRTQLHAYRDSGRSRP
jgi:arylsulfatase A